MAAILVDSLCQCRNKPDRIVKMAGSIGKIQCITGTRVSHIHPLRHGSVVPSDEGRTLKGTIHHNTTLIPYQAVLFGVMILFYPGQDVCAADGIFKSL
jgi:hypothetical protein